MRPRRAGLVALAVLIGLPGLLIAPAKASAEVVDSAPNGFTSRHTVTVSASPSETWLALANDISAWWNGDHSFSADAANLSLDVTPGGCMHETLPDGGWVCHLEVVHSNPGKLLRLRGGLGPLQGMAVTGALSWQLAPGGDAESADEGNESTVVTVTYAVTGYLSGGLDGWAAPVDGVIGEQVTRFARYVDTGSPTEDEGGE